MAPRTLPSASRRRLGASNGSSGTAALLALALLLALAAGVEMAGCPGCPPATGTSDSVRVVVQLQPSLHLPYRPHAERAFGVTDAKTWDILRQQFPGISLTPVFTLVDSARIVAVQDSARTKDAKYEAPDLVSFYSVAPPRGVPAESLAAHLLAASAIVADAYVVGPPDPPPQVHGMTGTNPLAARQGYREATPAGIGIVPARAAAGAPAGLDGRGVTFVDIEQGWKPDPDLPTLNYIIGVSRPAHAWHGAAVLGIVAARDDDQGYVGIAPAATVRVASEWKSATTAYDIADVIEKVLATYPRPAVLLIESQRRFPYGSSRFRPVEMLPAAFAAIAEARGLGVTVVEAAGDGSSLLDTVADRQGKHPLDRTRVSEFRDSGAILVAAATKSVPHERILISNYGNRIDCFAWGEGVATVGTKQFKGTSSAAAIIAGVAVATRAMFAARGLHPSTDEIRALLGDRGAGVPAFTHGATGGQSAPAAIGVMPDLEAIAHTLQQP